MGRPIDEALWNEWRRRLSRYEQWDGSITSFCTKEGISTASFYLWRRKLEQPREERRSSRSTGRDGPAVGPLFLPVRIEQPEMVEIELPNGARVRVPAGASRAINAAIIAAGRVMSAEARAC